MKGKYDLSKIDKIVGYRLKEERILKGRSQKDVGTAVGVTLQQIQKYEAAVNRASFSMLVNLCYELGIDVREFLVSVIDVFEASETANSARDQKIVDEAKAKATLSLVKSFKRIKNNEMRALVLEVIKSTADLYENAETPQ
jgi:transcriptional regulator with XRE-family HTH domain